MQLGKENADKSCQLHRLPSQPDAIRFREKRLNNKNRNVRKRCNGKEGCAMNPEKLIEKAYEALTAEERIKVLDQFAFQIAKKRVAGEDASILLAELERIYETVPPNQEFEYTQKLLEYLKSEWEKDSVRHGVYSLLYRQLLNEAMLRECINRMKMFIAFQNIAAGLKKEKVESDKILAAFNILLLRGVDFDEEDGLTPEQRLQLALSFECENAKKLTLNEFELKEIEKIEAEINTILDLVYKEQEDIKQELCILLEDDKSLLQMVDGKEITSKIIFDVFHQLILKSKVY